MDTQSEGAAGRPLLQAVVPIDSRKLIEDQLESLGLTIVHVGEGRYCAKFEDFGVDFRFDDDPELFSMHALYNARFHIDHKPQLLEHVNEWNCTHLWPKMFTDTHDGATSVCASAQMFTAGGVLADQLLTGAVTWLNGMTEISEWLKRLPVPSMDNGKEYW